MGDKTQLTEESIVERQGMAVGMHAGVGDRKVVDEFVGMAVAEDNFAQVDQDNPLVGDKPLVVDNSLAADNPLVVDNPLAVDNPLVAGNPLVDCHWFEEEVVVGNPLESDSHFVGLHLVDYHNIHRTGTGDYCRGSKPLCSWQSQSLL